MNRVLAIKIHAILSSCEKESVGRQVSNLCHLHCKKECRRLRVQLKKHLLYWGVYHIHVLGILDINFLQNPIVMTITVHSCWVNPYQHIQVVVWNVPPTQDRMQWSCVSTRKMWHRTSNITCIHVWCNTRNECTLACFYQTYFSGVNKLEVKEKVVCYIYTYAEKKSRNDGITICSFKPKLGLVELQWYRTAITHQKRQLNEDQQLAIPTKSYCNTCKWIVQTLVLLPTFCN